MSGLQSVSEDGQSDTNTFVWIEDTKDDESGKGVKTIKRTHSVFLTSDKELTEEERKELRDALVSARGELPNRDELREEIKLALAEADGQVTRISVSCDGDPPKPVASDGQRKTVFICKSEVMASALTGLKEARKQLAKDGTLPEEARDEVLRALDEQIERLGKES